MGHLWFLKIDLYSVVLTVGFLLSLMLSKITCGCSIFLNYDDSGLVDINIEPSQFSVGKHWCDICPDFHPVLILIWGNVLTNTCEINRTAWRIKQIDPVSEVVFTVIVLWHRRAKVKGTKGEKCVCVITLYPSKGCGHSCITGPHFPSTHVQSKSSLTHLVGTGSIPSIKSYCFHIPCGHVRPSYIH